MRVGGVGRKGGERRPGKGQGMDIQKKEIKKGGRGRVCVKRE